MAKIIKTAYAGEREGRQVPMSESEVAFLGAMPSGFYSNTPWQHAWVYDNDGKLVGYIRGVQYVRVTKSGSGTTWSYVPADWRELRKGWGS